MAGRAPTGSPGEQTFWVAQVSGSGEQTLEWEPEDGDWQLVLMNADASRGVSSELAIGAELDSVLWIGIGLLVAGALLATWRRWRSAPVSGAVGAQRQASRKARIWHDASSPALRLARDQPLRRSETSTGKRPARPADRPGAYTPESVMHA